MDTKAQRNSGKRSTKSWKRTLAYAAIPVGTLTVLGAGCNLATLLQILMLFMGATPAGNFADTGQVALNMVPVDESGAVSFLTENLYTVEVTDPPQTAATVSSVESKPAVGQGAFIVLLDSSSSMTETDPDRIRVDATQRLTDEVLDRSEASRLAVFDFGYSSNGDFEHTRTLTDYTSDANALNKGASETLQDGWTPLYDSLHEVLDSMDNEVKSHFQTARVDKGIVVVTDGEDNSTTQSLVDVTTKASNLGVPIHVIGLADASEFGSSGSNYQTSGSSRAITELRQLASKTGGVYVSVREPSDLIDAANTVALALVGGFETTNVTLDPPPASGSIVKGRIKIRGLEDTQIGDSLSGQWEFVAP